MNKSGPKLGETTANVAAVVRDLPLERIEKLTIEAILRYRVAIQAEEAAYLAWNDDKSSQKQLESLFLMYKQASHNSRVQQIAVAALIDVLGYIPEIE